MKIEQLKKLSGGRYQLILSNGHKLTLYEDIVIKYNLLPNKELDASIINGIENDNLYATSYNLALKYLAIRLRSEYEIKQYLIRKGIDNKIIVDTINRLQDQGYINDELFVKAFINDKILMTNWGPYKIQNELEKYGVKYYGNINELISSDILDNRIKKIINKLVATNKANSTNMLKNKILSYLINLGYSKESVIDYIEDIKVQDEEARYKKEYDKLYKKYKNKYDSKQLDRIIKHKLYQKGFTNN